MLGLALGLGANQPAQGGGPVPASLPGNPLTAWYDASDVTSLFLAAGLSGGNPANGQTVLSVKDKSNNGYHLGGNTSGPTYSTGLQNGLAGLAFPGTASTFLKLVAVAGLLNNVTSCSLVVVINQTALTTAEAWVMIDTPTSGNSRASFRTAVTTGNLVAISRRSDSDGGGTTTGTANAIVAATSATCQLDIDYANGRINAWNNSALAINNTSVVWTSGVGPTSATDPADAFIGSTTAAGATLFGGSLFEVLIYAPKLTTVNQATLNAYLRSKWATW